MSDARLRRDIVWNLVPVALLAVVGLGLNFLIGGWWGAKALGSFTLVTIPFFAFAVVGACGIQYAVLKAVAEEPEDRRRVAEVVVGALIPTIVVAAAMAALFALLRRPIGALLDSEPVAEGMLWAAPGVFCFAINKVLMGVVNGLRRMRAFAIYTSLRYALLGVGILFARWAGLDADQLPVIWTLTEGVLLLVLVIELLATVSVRLGARGWRVWARRHVDFGARGVLATLAQEINSKIDVWLLGVALPDDKVGIYALASALYEGALQLSIVLQNNLNPIIARDLGLGERAAVEELARRTRKWFVPAMGVACLVGAVIYPLAIPTLLGDPAFAEGTIAFAIMMGGLALASPWLPFNQVLLMAGKPGWYTVYLVTILAVNFVGCVILIPGFALEGAAAATTASMIVSAALVPVMCRWKVSVRL